MVAPSYLYSRGIQLCFTFCGLFTTSLQIYILHQRKIKVEIKYYLHYCCFFSLFFNIFNCIDPDGVLKIFPFLFLSLAEVLVTSCIAIGLCLIIYGHFHAHYLSLKKSPPLGLRAILSLSTGFAIFFNLLGTGLKYGLNLASYGCIDSGGIILWLISVVFADLYSYYLVRKLIRSLPIETKILRMQPSISSTKNKPNTANHSQGIDEYDNLLKRMRNFHILAIILCVFFILVRMNDFITSIQAWNTPPIYPDPNHFTFNKTAEEYIFYFLWGILTWWAWIPIKEDLLRSHLSKSEPHHTSLLQQSDACVLDENKQKQQIQMLSTSPSNESLNEENQKKISPSEAFDQSFVEGAMDQDLYVT